MPRWRAVALLLALLATAGTLVYAMRQRARMDAADRVAHITARILDVVGAAVASADRFWDIGAAACASDPGAANDMNEAVRAATEYPRSRHHVYAPSQCVTDHDRDGRDEFSDQFGTPLVFDVVIDGALIPTLSTVGTPLRRVRVAATEAGGTPSAMPSRARARSAGFDREFGTADDLASSWWAVRRR